MRWLWPKTRILRNRHSRWRWCKNLAGGKGGVKNIEDMHLFWSYIGAMSVNLSIKNVPDDLAERLRLRAAANHRSLQGELMAIIEAAVQPARQFSPLELVAEVRRRGISSSASAAEIIRADRDRDDQRP